MDETILHDINQEIYAKFPYLEGVIPQQKTLPGSQVQLIYSGMATTENGIQLPMIVKVKLSTEGHILAVTTSR